MKFTSTESIKALEHAQAREKEAYEFYETCSDAARITGTKAVVTLLVDEEKKHYSLVSDMLAQARQNSQPGDTTIAGIENPKKILEKSFGHEHIGDFSAEKASVIDMLRTALKNEEESYTLYSEAERAVEEEEAASVYHFLAGEENKHYIMIGNLLEYLDDPGKWLYEEENVIFRR